MYVGYWSGRICMNWMQVLTSVKSLYVCSRGRHLHACIRTGSAVYIAYNMCRSRCSHVLYENAFHKQLRNAFYSCLYGRQSADPSGCTVLGVGLRPLPCWDCGFESRRGYRCLTIVNIVCCQASGWSLVQRNLILCFVSQCDRKAALMRNPCLTRGCCATEKEYSSVSL